MPDHKTPGVFVDEVSFRSKLIEGVPTAVAAFVGPTAAGPTSGKPGLLTSFGDFEATFGGLDDLTFDGVARTNFVAHAARAFFVEGGQRLHVARIARDDAGLPTADDYRGSQDRGSARPTGLRALETLPDISIVACPGYSFGYENGGDRHQIEQIQIALIQHCEDMRHRFAVLDSADNQTVTQVRQFRRLVDSSRAAMYYPWIQIARPNPDIPNDEILLPPCGFVAGIFARTDRNRGVHKAPANEVLNLAVGFESDIGRAEQEILNPEGINCFRTITGRGRRLWGARTASSDPEWKYVNARRLVSYLERSIEKGTQWAVFEPNGEPLWANVRRSVEDFLLAEWRSERLLGRKPEEAFFVRCDRTTMTQTDIDNGRLICLVGVAPLRPAEFVIFRIGQKTADGR